MLDIIASLRTNNPQKIPGYDPDRIENMRTLLKTHIKGIRCIIANHLHYMTNSDVCNDNACCMSGKFAIKNFKIFIGQQTKAIFIVTSMI